MRALLEELCDAIERNRNRMGIDAETAIDAAANYMRDELTERQRIRDSRVKRRRLMQL